MILVHPSNAAAAQTGFLLCTVAMAMIWDQSWQPDIQRMLEKYWTDLITQKAHGAINTTGQCSKNFHCICRVHKEQPLGLCSRIRKRDPHHNTRRTTEKILDERLCLSKALPCFPTKGIDHPASKMCSVAHRSHFERLYPEVLPLKVDIHRCCGLTPASN